MKTKLGLVIGVLDKNQAEKKGISKEDMRTACNVSMSVIEADEFDELGIS